MQSIATQRLQFAHGIGLEGQHGDDAQGRALGSELSHAGEQVAANAAVEVDEDEVRADTCCQLRQMGDECGAGADVAADAAKPFDDQRCGHDGDARCLVEQ